MREIRKGEISVQDPVSDETALGGLEIFRRIVIQVFRNTKCPLVGSVESAQSRIFFEISLHTASRLNDIQSKMAVDSLDSQAGPA